MVTNQAYLFLIFIVNGIIIGLLFDLFMFLGIILGAFIYLLTLSSYIIKINVKIINTILIPFKIIYHLMHKIIFKPITFLIINIRKSFTNFVKIPQKTKNIVKNW